MSNSRIRECQYCGKPYELCMGCDQSNFFSWKQVACSIECYQEIEKIAIGITTPKEAVIEENIEITEEIVKETIDTTKRK